MFDTAFTGPSREIVPYGIPVVLYRDHGIRKYGFHGTSHRYASHEAAKLLKKPIDQTKIVSCHLGNGSSITAVQGGKSIDTTMGLTPLAGVIMGTRPGDLDPFIPLFMIREMGMSVDEVDDALNKRSGFEGICHHHDVREIEELARAGDEDCQLALDMFTAPRGSSADRSWRSAVRRDCLHRRYRAKYPTCARASCDTQRTRPQIDPARNSRNERVITTDASNVAVFVVPANEELVIARDTARIVGSMRKPTAAVA